MYLKLLETFVLKVLFRKDEYNITSKHFNPIRFFTIMILVLNVFFTIYLVAKLNTIYERVSLICPAALKEPITVVKK